MTKAKTYQPKSGKPNTKGAPKNGRCWYHNPYQVFFLDVKLGSCLKEKW
jgi:hypothetical protein